MINKVNITNHLGETVTLELGAPEKSGFLVRGGGIDGLGPSKATINTTEVVTKDGADFNSARVGSRNIVFDLGFLPNPSIEYTRRNTYKYFPIKRKIKIEVETDTRVCETYGYVESNEPDIFSKDEGATISVICPDSYLYSAIQHVTMFSTIEPEFEFPFSNESTVDPLLEMGNIVINTQGTIVYTGDAPVGVVMYINFSGSVTELHISNEDTQEVMEIDDTKLAAITGSGFISGDQLVISTVKGDKYIHLQRSGTIYNVLNALIRGANWFQLENGNNLFVYTATTGITNLGFVIENRIAYEGV